MEELSGAHSKSPTNAEPKTLLIQGSTTNAATTSSGSTFSNEPSSSEEPTLSLSSSLNYKELLLMMRNCCLCRSFPSAISINRLSNCPSSRFWPFMIILSKHPQAVTPMFQARTKNFPSYISHFSCRACQHMKRRRCLPSDIMALRTEG
ncbi:hypothetical protein CRG98_013106 [Punica granatum]|uniref:Uncharacterized protein n=1 Tax=Punica granatum TaxID=22663 RepID=A0A2I0KDX8_PUNGR|nr:hypothetical protein CRG98_013106 [Punica granatum]